MRYRVNQTEKTAPDNAKFFTQERKFLVYVISKGTLSPIISRLADIQNLKAAKFKIDVISVLGAMGFYASYVGNNHIDAEHYYNVVKNYKFCIAR